MTSYVILAAEEEGSSSHNVCLGNYILNTEFSAVRKLDRLSFPTETQLFAFLGGLCQ